MCGLQGEEKMVDLSQSILHTHTHARTTGPPVRHTHMHGHTPNAQTRMHTHTDNSNKQEYNALHFT